MEVLTVGDAIELTLATTRASAVYWFSGFTYTLSFTPSRGLY